MVYHVCSDPFHIELIHQSPERKVRKFLSELGFFPCNSSQSGVGECREGSWAMQLLKRVSCLGQRLRKGAD